MEGGEKSGHEGQVNDQDKGLAILKRISGFAGRIGSTRFSGAPLEVFSSAAAVVAGIGAIVLGSKVSTAMSRVLDGNVDVVRMWGVLMVVGGSLILVGRFWFRPGIERAGLAVLGPTYFLYAISVLLGLGVGGLVTGPMFFALGLAYFARIRISLREEAARAAATKLLEGGSFH